MLQAFIGSIKAYQVLNSGKFFKTGIEYDLRHYFLSLSSILRKLFRFGFEPFFVNFVVGPVFFNLL